MLSVHFYPATPIHSDYIERGVHCLSVVKEDRKETAGVGRKERRKERRYMTLNEPFGKLITA